MRHFVELKGFRRLNLNMECMYFSFAFSAPPHHLKWALFMETNHFHHCSEAELQTRLDNLGTAPQTPQWTSFCSSPLNALVTFQFDFIGQRMLAQV